MLIDVLSLITPDANVLGNNYLSGSTPNVTFVSKPDGNGLQQLVYMKGLAGYPWDWLTVGQDFIYQRLTENVWSDPSTGKLMFGLGSPRFPRWIDYTPPAVTITPPAAAAPAKVPGLTATLESAAPPIPSLNIAGVWQFTVARPQTDYVIYGPGGVPVSRSSDANVRNTFHGPYAGAPVGDMPAGEDWIADYEWGGKLVNGVMQYGVLERVTHRKGYGRYQWQSFTATNGVYPATPQASSSTTKIVPLTSSVTPIQKIF